MRKSKYAIAAASLLLLIGAGCARTDTGAKIDVTVDGILDDQAAEQDELEGMMLEEQDTQEVEADEAELNTNLEATYEIK